MKEAKTTSKSCFCSFAEKGSSAAPPTASLTTCEDLDTAEASAVRSHRWREDGVWGSLGRSDLTTDPGSFRSSEEVRHLPERRAWNSDSDSDFWFISIEDEELEHESKGHAAPVPTLMTL